MEHKSPKSLLRVSLGSISFINRFCFCFFFILVCLFVLFCFLGALLGDQISCQSEESQLIIWIGLLHHMGHFSGQLCPSHMSKSSPRFLVFLAIALPYRPQCRELSEHTGNLLSFTLLDSGSLGSYVLLLLYQLACLVPFITLYVCVLNSDISENSDWVWFIFLIPSIQHNIWCIADANRYVWVRKLL